MSPLSAEYCTSLLDAAIGDIRDENYETAIREIEEIRRFIAEAYN